MSGKVNSLARMFAGFPSYRPSAGMLSETISTYLEVLEIYSDEEVAEACRRMTREAREFPPTAGEVRAMCEKVVLASAQPRPALTDETRPLVNDLTPEQRAANVEKFKALLVELGGNMRNAPQDATPAGKVRPAPFNFGPSLMTSLVEKGLVKVKTEEKLEQDEDAPTF